MRIFHEHPSTSRRPRGVVPEILARRSVHPYLVDAAQRSILFWDVLRQRGNQYLEHMAHAGAERPALRRRRWCSTAARCRGRSIMGWSRITPPRRRRRSIPSKRPFVVVDPRAGHGPGIGGFKADSEIGVALRSRAPMLLHRLPARTRSPARRSRTSCAREAAFLERVIELHPDADGKPAVIGNCQAGWAVMLVAAIRPELFGPIIIAGSPLSYWAGVRGQNPMRYTGGLLRRQLADGADGRPRRTASSTAPGWSRTSRT